MSYDPNFPTANTLADAVQVRAQFNGLKDITDALAATNITSVVIDAVNTVPAGQPANVTANVIGNTLHLTFDIPQGSAGTNGADGAPGAPGQTGSQGETGPAGEVTNASLVAAVAGTSANTNGVATLSVGASPGYDPAELQAAISKINELITALRRA